MIRKPSLFAEQFCIPFAKRDLFQVHCVIVRGIGGFTFCNADIEYFSDIYTVLKGIPTELALE